MMALKTPTKPAAKTGTVQKTGPVDELTGRPVIYDTITVCGIEIPEEALAATAEDAKALLGWETEQQHEDKMTAGLSPEQASKMNVKFLDEYDLKDYNGEKVRCSNNTRNRPLQMPWVEQLAQDILNENWRFNGESWIIGQTGLALSLQHRAHALIRAEQIRSYEGEDEAKLALAAHWQKHHPDPLTIPALVVRGVPETPDVTRTLDNVRPRSLSDVLFADTAMFAKTAKADREKLCRITDYAIRTVWHRTGESDDAFAPRRTHSESLEFLTRHPRLIKAVMHIYTEMGKKNSAGEKTNVLAEYITPGTAAGLMFLMGSSTSDRERWDTLDTPTDRALDFDRWPQAEEFWAGIGDPKNDTFSPVRKAISNCGNADTGATASTPVKIAVLVNAWNEFVDENGAITVKNVMPEFGPQDDYGRRPLKGTPSVGGIDLGDPKEVAKAREEEEAAEAAALAALETGNVSEGAPVDNEPDAEEQAAIEQRKAAEKKKHLDTKANGAPKEGAKKGLRGGTAK